MSKLKWLGLAVLALVLFLWWKKRKEATDRDAAHARRIAREPLY